MFGMGKVFGGMASGFLDKLGLGKMTPFVKMGLNALTGSWMGVAKDVFSLVSNFKSDFLDRASSQPPLGNFQMPSTAASPLSSNRMEQIVNLFERTFRNNKMTDGMRKILDALRAVKGTFDNYNHFDTQATRSIFSNMKI